MIASKNASKRKGGLPKLTGKQAAALYARQTTADIIHDTVEVANTITDILLGAMIEPGRDCEQWCRREIRNRIAAGTLKRLRTYDILRNAQLKPSAFEWLRYYFNKLELTKAPDGRHLHEGRLVEVDYSAPVVANV